MRDRNWYVALTGLAFLVLVIVGFTVAGEPPNPSDDSVQKIVDFYDDNGTEIWIATGLQVLAAAALVFFGGYLRKVLRAAEGEGHMLSAVVLSGATILATAAGLDATINVALVESVDDIDPAATQALSALWNNDFVVFGVGAVIFMLSAGLSIVRHGALPKWLGWVAIVIAVAMVTPAAIVGFPVAGLWIAVVSVLLAVRGRAVPPAAAPVAPVTG